MKKLRESIPQPIRAKVLIANQHACCICSESGVQIHHINGNPADNRLANLAILCIPHHDKATVVTGLSAKLKDSEIRKYKKSWETACQERVRRAARGRTAFFMVDYKNAERIRQLYSQLTSAEFANAYQILTEEFQEEQKKRDEQGFSISLEPNTAWNEYTQRMLSWVLAGNAHPDPFHKAKGHAKDPLFPTGAIWMEPAIAYYDLWCQIMVRAIIAVRTPYDLDDLLQLDEPTEANLSGLLVAFEAELEGDVFAPNAWKKRPLGTTILSREVNGNLWRCTLSLKTHYVYSDTAAQFLSQGIENGVLLLRSVRSVRKFKKKRVVEFEATPLIIGNGVLKL